MRAKNTCTWMRIFGNLYWFHILFDALMYNGLKPHTNIYTLQALYPHDKQNHFRISIHTQNSYLIINRGGWLCLWSKLLKNGIHYYHSYQFHFMRSTPVTFGTLASVLTARCSSCCCCCCRCCYNKYRCCFCFECRTFIFLLHFRWFQVASTVI